MALKVAKCDVWAVTIDDRPGGAAEKLENLSKAGANLEMVLARRTAENIHSVRIEGGDKPGLGSGIARALSDAGINFRGMSGVAIGSKFVSFIALDNADDQAKAIAALKKLK
jgi:hypothetical protein